MNKMLSTAKRTAGFTLIELLVVIGILGILAAALVATIDPFEQLKKANDANTENTEVELINAVIRYYTIHNAFPWDPVNSGGTACTTSVSGTGDLTLVNVGDETAGTGFAACLADLMDNGELKQSFDDAQGILDEIIIYETNTSVTTCYNPSSKAKTQDAQTNYVLTGSLDDPTSLAADAGTGAGHCAGNTGGDNEDCFKCTSG